MRAQSGSACGNAGATPAQTAKSSPVSRPTPAQACAVVAPVVFHEVGAGVESPTGPRAHGVDRTTLSLCRVPPAVLICSHCDRGQRYCAAGCAQRARAASLRAAGTRYQASFAGRLAHAQRQRRYRARRQEVTHQGSPPPAPPVEVRTAPTVPESVPSASGQCHLCHRALSPFVRQDFLHSPVRRPCPRSERSPPRHGPVP